MSSPNFPPVPPQLRPIQHFLKLAADYDNRQPVISYWARLFALQSALKIDRKSNEAKALLVSLMDWLEGYKKANSSNESITSDVAGQAVVENEAFKLFTKADSDDRAGIFTKNVVKTFYTAGCLFDVIEVFGELNEEIAAQRKYAKWKATYIHNCLKNGQMPMAGPIGGDGEEENSMLEKTIANANREEERREIDFQPPSETVGDPHGLLKEESFLPMPQEQKESGPTGGSHLTPECFAKCQKYCKYAISSLDYEDAPTAVDFLTKALNLLKTGSESSS